MTTLALLLLIGLLNLSTVIGVPLAGNGTRGNETEPNAITLAAASNYLIKFGYQSVTNNRLAPTPESLKSAIESLQRFAGLNVTGKLDEPTLALMAMPRCQIPDITTAGNRYVLARAKWNTNSLSYKIHNQPTSTMNIPSIQSIIATSLEDWSKVSPLRFSATSSAAANINIGFYSYSHGDDSPFDGLNGVLAHAYFPRDGRLHFDDSETWTESTNSGRNLRQVATHEFGHVLGLAHSTVYSAVMYPYYTGYKSNFALDDDDIKGIQAFYGSNNGNSQSSLRSSTTTSLRSTTTIRTCNGFYCAFIQLCIPNSWICDGDNDCKDFSDEANCSITQRPVTQRTTYPTRFRRTTRFIFFGRK